MSIFRVRQLRKARGLNQVQLAEAIGVSQGTISRLERGDQNISVETLVALASFFDMTVPELFAYQGKAEAIRDLEQLDPDRQQRAIDTLRAAGLLPPARQPQDG